MAHSRILKDLIDRVAAVLGLVVLAPLLVVIGLAVRATSKGPALYRRKVLGRRGVLFDAFKFRTMVLDAEAILEGQPALRAAFGSNVKLRDDPRVTPLGRILRRTSLDELPQLINVLRGQMSLVGPRMIAPDEAVRYGDFLTERLEVKPGLTGLWQVSGRQEVDYARRIALDREYLQRWSIWLDLVILLKTIPAVFSMRGAY